MTNAMTKVGHVRQALERLTDSYSFRGFAVVTIPAKESRKLADAVVLTNWPRDFLKNYDDGNMLTASPVVDRLRQSTVPFTYDTRFDWRRRSSPSGRETIALLERIRLQRGVFIPVHDAQGTCGAVTFSGDRETVSGEELKELTLMAGYLYSRLCEINDREKRPAGILSRREVECLHWAATGKTTAEIAKILVLSDYTVNHYLSRATRKLDSVNRVQTVAKAIRAGLID